jgi:hypothetical protein
VSIHSSSNPIKEAALIAGFKTKNGIFCYCIVITIWGQSPIKLRQFRLFNYVETSSFLSEAKQTLQLEMDIKSSDTNKTIAECTFWYWSDKEIVILKVGTS